jgi:hypothetical protein
MVAYVEGRHKLFCECCACRRLVSVKFCIFRHADHGKNLCKMIGQTESLDQPPGIACLHQELNDQSYSTRINVFHLREIQQDTLHFERQTLIGAKYYLLRRARNVSGEAQNGYGLAGRSGCLAHSDRGRPVLHLFAVRLLQMDYQSRAIASLLRVDPLHFIHQPLDKKHSHAAWIPFTSHL